jgi:hypothetical protein
MLASASNTGFPVGMAGPTLYDPQRDSMDWTRVVTATSTSVTAASTSKWDGDL